MEQLPEFISNHPLLFLALGIVLGLLAWNLLGEQISGIKSLLPQEAIQLINHEDAVILDVRQESEYTQGHILNSIHIPLNMLADKMGRLEKYRHRPIIASCLSGSRSVSACHMLKKNGFEKIHNLKGGMAAWQNASLPMIKGKS